METGNVFDASERISISLNAAEWNAVIAALIEQPYRIAAPLVQKIGEQARLNERARVPNGEGEVVHAPD
jgi:hypothetical protein